MTVNIIQYGNQQFTEDAQGVDAGVSIINDNMPLQKVCHSTQGSQGGHILLQVLVSSKGALPRYFAQKIGNLLIKH